MKTALSPLGIPTLLALVLALASGTPFLRADSLVETWKVAPGARTYLGTGNTERGATLNPVNGNVLLLSRVGTPSEIGRAHV